MSNKNNVKLISHLKTIKLEVYKSHWDIIEYNKILIEIFCLQVKKCIFNFENNYLEI